MARATRSSTQQQHQPEQKPDALHLPSQNATRKVSKKRKRLSVNADGEDHPSPKQPRPEPTYKDAGDLPLSSEDAHKILTVLEMIDTQGLLDRVFPLQSSDGPPHSLRSLLNDPSNYPLRVLRTAVHPLFPISSLPRSRPSSIASQQQKFCTLALSLFDQVASKFISEDRETVFIDDDDPATTLDVENNSKRKYALMQKLPSGETWWSSATGTRAGQPGLTAKEAKDLVIGQAELVGVLPSLPIPPEDVPRLGDIKAPRDPNRPVSERKHKSAVWLRSMKRSTARLLDYGPFYSFAPSFDSDGAEVCHEEIGEILWRRGLKAKEAALRSSVTNEEKMEIERDEEEEKPKPVIDPALLSEELFPPEELELFKSTLEDLQVQEGVAELLEHNVRALGRLLELQSIRLREGGAVEVGSEEWETAEQIMSSLSLLTSLRPRTAGSNDAPLIPPPSLLHALHQTLPIGASNGWQGGLLPERATALRDDTTIRMIPGAVAPRPAPVPVQQPPQQPQQYPYPPRSTPYSSYYPNAGSYATGTTSYQYGYAPGYGYPPQQYGYGYAQQYGQQQPYQQQRAVPNLAAKPLPMPAVGQQPANGWVGTYGSHAQVATPQQRRTPVTPGVPTYPGYTQTASGHWTR